MFLCLFYFYYSPCGSLYPIGFYYSPYTRFAVPYRVLLLTLYKVRDNGLRFGRGLKK